MALSNFVIEKSGILLKSPKFGDFNLFSPLKYGEFGGIFSKKLLCTSCRPPFFFGSPSDQISQEKKTLVPISTFQNFNVECKFQGPI
jgi:hypothetical protein